MNHLSILFALVLLSSIAFAQKELNFEIESVKRLAVVYEAKRRLKKHLLFSSFTDTAATHAVRSGD